MSNSYGDVTTSGTPALVFASISGTAQAPTTVAIKALAANSAAVYLGTDASVATTTGWQLAAGESIAFDLQGLDAIYVVSAVTQHVRFIATQK